MIIINFINSPGFWNQSPSNTTIELNAERNSTVLLNCPFESIPEANITWNFANGTTIEFNKMDRRVQIVSIFNFSFQ